MNPKCIYFVVSKNPKSNRRFTSTSLKSNQSPRLVFNDTATIFVLLYLLHLLQSTPLLLLTCSNSHQLQGWEIGGFDLWDLACSEMDNRRYNGRQNIQKRQLKADEENEASVLEEFAEEFRLPIHHRPVENVDLDNVEQASLDTQITSSNVGFRLLQKMGWKGKGLGKNEQGITEPIKSGLRDSKLGVGKQEQDDFFTAEENIQRRKLDIELEETEEIAKKREVMADREHKIQTEVKEIRKVFYCELCDKQYKLAVEFEGHLSSYDHNHRKRFKEMREMHGSSSRDDRQKREQLRQEREMAKFAQMADAHKQQQQQQQQEDSEKSNHPVKNATVLVDQDQRKALKFGFSSKGGASKSAGKNVAKKPKTPVASVFKDDSDEE
ncbi:hypothetical protein QVD17_27441 [Tagetes erecta]|uniref:G-patch domain-containing protein n=1 Tax=Tagetes erecta TaxID=13708 RepID=A0AAD8KB02_TARER|nr:hypothetical protein QVD17_27441 [Tagetes erecta]